jgi:flagellar hook protein FlgE
MSLTSSLFSGISGLSTLGNSMQIIGDNIANVNTVGFKAGSYVFQDLLSQATATQSGTSQIGRGVALGDVYSTFEQGSFESTGNTTDLAIGGDGFFVLRQPSSDRLFYSRAGNFSFDKEGYLVNPEGYIIQGWVLDENGDDIGSVTDIMLSSFTSPPDESDRITVITNLDSDALSSTTLPSVFSDSWDSTLASGPIASSSYNYQSTVKVYDSLGSSHDITIYYDKNPSSDTSWDYLITCNPDEDMRNGGAFVGTTSAGLLARGQIDFNEGSGTIMNIGMDLCTAPGVWTANATNANGYYEFTPDFFGGAATNMSIEFDIGSRDSGGGTFANDSLTTTQFARSSTTTFQSANGYGSGDFQGVDVDVDGVITGIYSNGQLIELNRVALAKFLNVQGLHKEGGNLYRQTRDSGDAITSHPGTNGLGNIAPNSLEQSNVDIADEFVRMITSQRGFQANSKIITTVDQMLADTINLKR